MATGSPSAPDAGLGATGSSGAGGVERRGRCLCGRIRYRIAAEAPLTEVLHCHCVNCRRISGNFVAAVRVDDDHLLVDDPSAVRWQPVPEARYGLCPDCGSTLFFEADDRDRYRSVMVGTLDDAGGIPLGAVWFADEAQAHHVVPAGVPHHTGNG